MFHPLVVLCVLTSIAFAETDSDVVVLTLDNFEHLTQLNSGATTGDWFIKFYAPWCGHCKRLAPTWEEVATDLKGEVNVAKVDVTENRALGKQFGVKGFPTLLLFRRGKMEKYSGARTKEALSEWARTAEPTDDLPGPLSIADTAVSGMVKILEDLFGVINKFPVSAAILSVGGLFVGILFGAVFAMCCGCGGSVEYRDRIVYKQRDVSGAVSSNGPPPIDDDEEEETDPKTKKTN